MSVILINVVAFLVAIGILVAVHEFGHYSVARLFGVKVLRFSIGFGKPIWMLRAGSDQTEYCISAIPLGGYVKLLDEREGEIAETERDRTFNSQSLLARIAILLAGPVFNFIFAVLAYWAVFGIGIPGIKPVIGAIEPDSIAATAGLVQQDQIISVGGKAVATWNTAVLGILDDALANGVVTLEIESMDGHRKLARLPTSGLERELTEPGQLFPVLGFDIWRPEFLPVIGEVVSGGPAEKAGMLSGDRVVSADSEEIASWPDWVEFIRARPGKTIEVVAIRSDRLIKMSVTLESLETKDGVVGRIGAIAEDFMALSRASERYEVVPAFFMAMNRTWEMTVLTVRMVSKMVTGEVSTKNISGPISIAQFVGFSATVGVAFFLRVLAIISLSLGILNLLPVPMLDGGQIVYQLIEAVKGSPLSDRAQMFGQQVGILFLLVLMSFAFYNDFARILG